LLTWAHNTYKEQRRISVHRIDRGDWNSYLAIILCRHSLLHAMVWYSFQVNFVHVRLFVILLSDTNHSLL
jgi:hypothetical protein